jgi:sugar phosphate permease
MSLDPTLGAVELGAIFSTLLFGIITVQAFDYYRDYPNDSWTLKAMVCTVLYPSSSLMSELLRKVGSIWLGHNILPEHVR